MQFEAKLPRGIDASVLGQAGLETEEFIDLSLARFERKKPSFPATVQSHYSRLDGNIPVTITVFGFGENERIDRSLDSQGRIVVKRGVRPTIPTHIRIEIADDKIGTEMKKVLDHYSLENDGEGIVWRDHCALYERINDTLESAGLSTARLQERHRL